MKSKIISSVRQIGSGHEHRNNNFSHVSKKLILFAVLLIQTALFSQEHFAGLTTSGRSGIITAGMNPAELVNMSNTYEVNIFGVSANVANNKIGFSDLTSDKNIEELIWEGDEPVNLRFNTEVYGPSFAMKYNKWAFGITTKANGKLDVVDVDTKLGDAIANSGLNNILLASTFLNNNGNQRIIGTTWGEVNLSAAGTLFENPMHKLNGGITLKLLFPGSYANLGAGQFTGTISQSLGQVYLTDANANLNIAYSGTLANSFSNFDDYAKSVFGSLNGCATDFGVNYQWKDENNSDDTSKSAKNKYKLNAGLAFRNIGSMTFKDSNNNSTNYKLEIQGTESLNLNQFENVDNLQEIETILLNSGYLTKQSGSKDFKVVLPATFSLYADVKIIPILYVSAFLQQKMKDDNENDQITAQNIFTLTPRLNIGAFETYIPFSNSDVSGFNTGIGFQYRGFYIGSGSIITALINDSKQADAYIGFRWGFL